MLRGRLNDLYLYEVKARGEQRFSGESFKGVVKGFTAAGSRKPESYSSCKSVDGTAPRYVTETSTESTRNVLHVSVRDTCR